ncbi:MAG: TonB-dependent receptor [Microscillaceae bacterium]|nr:TonB-dependent receptor [Microscillaceae bacterium]
MKQALTKFVGVLFLFLLLSFGKSNAQTTVSGTIYDAENNEPLIGVNVALKGSSIGAITDVKGQFSLTTNTPTPFILSISSIGYAPTELEITGSTSGISISLEPQTIIGQELVVSASRKTEKIQEAPASISVINAVQIANTPVTNPLLTIDNEPGVQLDRHSSSRMNVTMRGASDVFGTETFVIQDYRSLIGAGIGTFESANTTLSTLDLERVEVVRGPGSALYGPGVTAGVVHFLTKDPFRYPGTSVEMTYGELNTFRSSLRHAGHSSDGKFGYKVNLNFNRSDEWTLDPNDPDDAAVISQFQENIIDPLDGEVVRTTGGQLLNENMGYSMNTSLEFRPKDNLQIVASGGYSWFKGLYWNAQGEGVQQANDYFAQIRLQAGRLFAQVFWNANHVPSDRSKVGFLYRSGQLSYINRDQLEAQIQYTFDMPKIRTQMIVGGEYRGAFSDTDGIVYGRNEEDDAFQIYGTYFQSKTGLYEKLDLVLAARFDAFSSVSETSISPRAALVYKVSPTSSFRVSYNKAYAPNSALVNNIDFKLAATPAFDVWLIGNKNEQTFNNPSTTWLIPGLGETPGVGMDIGLAYGFLTQVIAAQIQAGNPQLQGLAGALPVLTDPATLTDIAGLGAFSNGVTIDNDGRPLNIEGTPTSQLRNDDNFEIGYKGVIGKKLAASVDLYWVSRKNFTLFTQISPLVVLPTLGADVASNITPVLTQIFTQLGDPNAAVTAQTIAGAYQAVANSSLTGPLGLVGTDQLPDSQRPLQAFGYRTFGEISYFGTDIGLTYFIRPDISIFGNYSWVNQNEFRGADLGEDENSTNSYSLNIPRNKFRIGFAYEPDQGLFGNFAVRYNESFNADLGLYSGEVKSRTVVDASVGYNFNFGLSLILNGTNIFDQEYRTFPNIPKIGRQVLFTARYVFDKKDK